jgi:hypothetical protein
MSDRWWGAGLRRNLSTGQKTGALLFLAIDLALLAAALWDLSRRRPDEVRGGRRPWYGLVFIDVFGPVAYFAFGRKVARPGDAPASLDSTAVS